MSDRDSSSNTETDGEDSSPTAQAGESQTNSSGHQSQPGGQQAQPAGTQTRTAANQGPSITDMLQRPASKAHIQYFLGVFALVGVSVGIGGYFALDQFVSALTSGSGSGFVSSSGPAALFTEVFIVLLVLGPVLAVFLVEGLGDALEMEPKATYGVAFIGTFAGHIVSVLLAMTLFTLLNGGDIGEMLGTIFVATILMGVFTGLVAVGIEWVDDWAFSTQQTQAGAVRAD